jgi:hypothetical protein
MKCGNGSDRTQHPFELFGEDWRDWGHDFAAAPAPDKLLKHGPSQKRDQ